MNWLRYFKRSTPPQEKRANDLATLGLVLAKRNPERHEPILSF